MNIRRAFAYGLLEGIRIMWPVLSIILVFIAGVGAVVGLVEGWGIWRGLYFGFITALTIGYGDLVPTRPLTQLLAVLAGFAGITLAALLSDGSAPIRNSVLGSLPSSRVRLEHLGGRRCYGDT